MSGNNLDAYEGSENENTNTFEEVSFDEIEDKLQKKFNETGLDKPTFDKNTNATVKGVELTRGIKPKKDSKDREFYDLILRVTCTIDGQKDDEGNPLETSDNYSGLREYPNHFWNGPNSALGKLRKLAEDEFGITNYQELLRQLLGSKVKIKTEKSFYQGKEYQKNIIQTFR